MFGPSACQTLYLHPFTIQATIREMKNSRQGECLSSVWKEGKDGEADPDVGALDDRGRVTWEEEWEPWKGRGPVVSMPLWCPSKRSQTYETNWNCRGRRRKKPSVSVFKMSSSGAGAGPQW